MAARMTNNIHEGSIRDEMSSRSQYSKAFIRKFSNELFDAIRYGLLEDGHVSLYQFGSFKLKWSGQRKGINPQTGEPLTINAHPRVIFTPSKALKNKLPISLNSMKPNLETDCTIPPVKTYKNASPQKATRTPLPILDNPPYLINKPHQQHQNNNNTISLKAMAAGFFSLFIFVYFFYPEPVTIQTTASSHRTAPLVTSNINVDSIPANTRGNELAENPLPVKIEPTTNHKTESSENTTTAFFVARKHKLANGNSLWRLSKKHYINPFYWPHIYQANRYNIHNPDKLHTGKVIELPALYGHPEQLTSIDKQNIAEGYFLAYQYYRKTGKPYPYYALIGAIKYDPLIIERHIYEIADEDWENLQLASN